MILKIVLCAFSVLIGRWGTQEADLDLLVQQPQMEADTSVINAMLNEISEEVSQGKLSSVRGKIEAVLETSRKIGYHRGIQLSLLELSTLYLNAQHFDSAKVVLETLLESYPESDYRSEFLNLLGTAYRYLNENHKAIETYQLALAGLDTVTQKRIIIGINYNLGVAYLHSGMKNEALSRYMQALQYAEAYNDTTLLVITLNAIGNALNALGEWDRAGFYLEKSIALAKEKSLFPDLLRAINNLANLKSNREEMEEALELYSEALELSKKIRPNTPPYMILYNLGNTYRRMGNLLEARNYFIESLGYCQELSIQPGIYYNSVGLGDVAKLEGNLAEALSWFNQASEVANRSGSNEFKLESLQKLYEINKQIGDKAAALDYLEQYKAFSDSLLDLEREKEFAELKNQLEMDRQREINKLLQEKHAQQEKQLRFQYVLIGAAIIVIFLVLVLLTNTRKANKEKTEAYIKLKAQQLELEKLNKEMNRVFAIISHDLRSPLTSLRGLLFLLKEGGLSEKETQKFTNDLENSVEQNIDVIEELLGWAKEQMSGMQVITEVIDAQEIVEEVIDKQEHRANAKLVAIQNELTPGTLIKGDKNALHFIFRNLLSNSIKFTKAGDTIRFTGKDLGDTIELCVIDNGVGMSKETRDQLLSDKKFNLSHEGTSGEKGTGFGLSIVKEFVRKLNGTLRIESEEGVGTKFCIALPKG